MSVCNEKFFVRINVYHSDDVLLFPEKQCGNLTVPGNGSIISPSGVQHWGWSEDTVSGEYGDVATFRCNYCYELEKNSSSEVKCKTTGEWSGMEPTCQSMHLDLLLTVEIDRKIHITLAIC